MNAVIGFKRHLSSSNETFSTFAEVFGVQRQTVARKRLQEELVAGPPARLRDARGHALHSGHALEERRLSVEANQLVELREDAVPLDFLFFRKLKHRQEVKSF